MFDHAHALPIAGAARDSILPQAVADAIAPLTWIAGGLYVFAVAALALYGLHSLWLLALFLRHRKAAGIQAASEESTALPADAELPLSLIHI
jgi:hypothetical protein